nr:hypothetical protein [Endozoicomonas sp.]
QCNWGMMHMLETLSKTKKGIAAHSIQSVHTESTIAVRKDQNIPIRGGAKYSYRDRLKYFRQECSNSQAVQIMFYCYEFRFGSDITGEMLVAKLHEKHTVEGVIDKLLEVCKRLAPDECSGLIKILEGTHEYTNAGGFNDGSIQLNNAELTPALLMFAEESNHDQIARLAGLCSMSTKWNPVGDPFVFLRKASQRCVKVDDLLIHIKEDYKDSEFYFFKRSITSSDSVFKNSVYPDVSDINSKWIMTGGLIEDTLNKPMAEAKEKGAEAKQIIENIERQLSFYWGQSPANREQFKAIFVPAHGKSDNIHNPAEFIRKTDLTLNTFRNRCLDNYPFFNSFLYAASSQAVKELPDVIENIDDIALCEVLDKSRQAGDHVFSKIISDLCVSLEKIGTISSVVPMMARDLCVNISRTDKNDFGEICSALINRGVTIGALIKEIGNCFEEDECRKALNSFKDEAQNVYKKLKKIKGVNRKYSSECNYLTNIRSGIQMLSMQDSLPLYNDARNRLDAGADNNGSLMEVTIDFADPSILRMLGSFACEATQEQLRRLSRRYDIQHLVQNEGVCSPVLFLKAMSKKSMVMGELLSDLNKMFKVDAFPQFKKQMNADQSLARCGTSLQTEKVYKSWPFESLGGKILNMTFVELINAGMWSDISMNPVVGFGEYFDVSELHRESLKAIFITDSGMRDGIVDGIDFRNYLNKVKLGDFLRKCDKYKPSFNRFIHLASGAYKIKLSDNVSETALCEIHVKNSSKFMYIVSSLGLNVKSGSTGFIAVANGLGLNIYRDNKRSITAASLLHEAINCGVTMGALFEVLGSVDKAALTIFKEQCEALHCETQ